MLLQGTVGVPSPIFTPPPIPAPIFPPPLPLSPQLQQLQHSSDKQLLICSLALASGIAVVTFLVWWHDRHVEKKKRRDPILTDEERNREKTPNRKHAAKHY